MFRQVEEGDGDFDSDDEGNPPGETGGEAGSDDEEEAAGAGDPNYDADVARDGRCVLCFTKFTGCDEAKHTYSCCGGQVLESCHNNPLNEVTACPLCGQSLPPDQRPPAAPSSSSSSEEESSSSEEESDIRIFVSSPFDPDECVNFIPIGRELTQSNRDGYLDGLILNYPFALSIRYGTAHEVSASRGPYHDESIDWRKMAAAHRMFADAIKLWKAKKAAERTARCREILERRDRSIDEYVHRRVGQAYEWDTGYGFNGPPVNAGPRDLFISFADIGVEATEWSADIDKDKSFGLYITPISEDEADAGPVAVARSLFAEAQVHVNDIVYSELDHDGEEEYRAKQEILWQNAWVVMHGPRSSFDYQWMSEWARDCCKKWEHGQWVDVEESGGGGAAERLTWRTLPREVKDKIILFEKKCIEEGIVERDENSALDVWALYSNDFDPEETPLYLFHYDFIASVGRPHGVSPNRDIFRIYYEETPWETMKADSEYLMMMIDVEDVEESGGGGGGAAAE